MSYISFSNLIIFIIEFEFITEYTIENPYFNDILDYGKLNILINPPTPRP
jgi:hypothetical protein